MEAHIGCLKSNFIWISVAYTQNKSDDRSFIISKQLITYKGQYTGRFRHRIPITCVRISIVLFPHKSKCDINRAFRLLDGRLIVDPLRKPMGAAPERNSNRAE